MLRLMPINIPNGLSTIDDGAFNHYCILQNIAIPKKCSVVDGAFLDCESLSKILDEEGQDWLKISL